PDRSREQTGDLLVCPRVPLIPLLLEHPFRQEQAPERVLDAQVVYFDRVVEETDDERKVLVDCGRGEPSYLAVLDVKPVEIVVERAACVECCLNCVSALDRLLHRESGEYALA